MRRIALLIVVVAVLSAVWLRATRYEPTRPGVPPRNLVLVTCAGLRADHASFLGYGVPTTRVPSDETQRNEGRAMGLDDLAAAGVLIANGRSPASDPASALATLFTGLTPLVHGARGDAARLDPSVVTLTQRLREAHFTTAAFVTGADSGLEGLLGAGFQTFQACADDTRTLTAATRWMDRDVGSKARLFVWVHLAGPVPPWDGRVLDEDVEASIAALDFRIPASGAADGSHAFLERLAQSDPASASSELGDSDRAQLRALYDREVARLTFGLEKFLRRSFDPYAGAEASETWPSTVFACASIFGLELGERGALGCASSAYESVLRVPFLLRHPESLTGERILATPVDLADLFPTLLEWFELDVPAAVHAQSMFAILDARPRRSFEARASCVVLPERVISVRTGRWHLLWNPLGVVSKGRARGALPRQPIELYDVVRDPGETSNVATLHPELVAELQRTFRMWREREKPLGTMSTPQRP